MSGCKPIAKLPLLPFSTAESGDKICFYPMQRPDGSDRSVTEKFPTIELCNVPLYALSVLFYPET
jgi:hypothetical protein